MSKRRPSPREKLEAEYLSAVANVLTIQKQLDALEAPRNTVTDTTKHDEFATVEAPTISDDTQESAPNEYDPTDWESRCQRITALSVGILRQIRSSQEKQPRLAAHIALLALGVDCESMHKVAAVYGLSVERIRQRVEETRTRFNLPKNQHNKSDEAVRAYKETAQLFSNRIDL